MDPLRDPTCYWLFIRKRKRKIERNFISNSSISSGCKQDDAILVAKDSCTTHSVEQQTTTNNLLHSEQYAAQSIQSEGRELQLLHSIHGDSVLPTNNVQLEHVYPQGSSPTRSSRQITIQDEASHSNKEDSEQFSSTIKKESKSSHVQFQDENANATSNHPSTTSNSSSEEIEWHSDVGDFILRRYYSGEFPIHQRYGFYKKYSAAGDGAVSSPYVYKYMLDFPPDTKFVHSTGLYFPIKKKKRS